MARKIGMLSIYCLATMFSNIPVAVHAVTNHKNVIVHKVRVSAYTNIASCTDDTPSRTASSLVIKEEHYRKVIALSPDLARQYEFGDKFELRVKGKSYLVEFQDIMPRKHKNKIDFLLPSKKKCMEFGVSSGVLIPMNN